jgi:ribosomal protein S21
MVSVTKTKDQNKDSLLRRFTRLVSDEGIVEEVRERMFHKTPSLIKKEKRKELEKSKKRRYRS